MWRASSDDHADLSTRILQSNPILEATGNAKTVRSNDSNPTPYYTYYGSTYCGYDY